VSAVVWSVTLVLLASASTSTAGESGDQATFMQSVAKYIEFTTPRCAPEMVGAYNGLNNQRDREFVQSLAGTELAAAYRDASAEQRARERNAVHHCSGPPPAPGTSAAAANPRDRAIATVQQELRSQADDIPAYFDRADQLFMRMVEVRDRLVSPGEPQ